LSLWLHRNEEGVEIDMKNYSFHHFTISDFTGKGILPRLLKNSQMQGARNLSIRPDHWEE